MYVEAINPSINLVAEFEHGQETSNSLQALSEYLENIIGVEVRLEADDMIREKKGWPWQTQKTQYVSIDD